MSYDAFQHFSSHIFIVQFQDTEHRSLVCAWGMDEWITNPHRKSFGERCINAVYRGQLICAHKGCSATVHRLCKFAWLASMPFIAVPVYCLAHHKQRGDYIRQYYRNRGAPTPPEDLAQLADDPSHADTSDISASLSCSICNEGIIVLNDRRYFTRTQCNHTFHSTCLETYMRTQVRFFLLTKQQRLTIVALIQCIT